jgi:hypothetical protein
MTVSGEARKVVFPVTHAPVGPHYMRCEASMGRSASIALGAMISVCLLVGAAEAFAQNGACRNRSSDPKNPNCGAPQVCNCDAQGQVDRFTKEGVRTLGLVKQQLAAAAAARAQCSQSSQQAGALWQACKASYQSQYDKCLQEHTRTEDGPLPKSATQSLCDAQLAKYCKDTPSSEHQWMSK